MRSLRMFMMSKRVLKELEGTFAARLYALWDEEAEAALWWVNEELCNRHIGKACNFGRTRKEFRWALGVVRSFAFNLTKRTSGKSFLSLVPYGNLLAHKRGAGGRAVLELDNTIRLAVGEAGAQAGSSLFFDRGRLGDAETMLRYVCRVRRMELHGTHSTHARTRGTTCSDARLKKDDECCSCTRALHSVGAVAIASRAVLLASPSVAVQLEHSHTHLHTYKPHTNHTHIHGAMFVKVLQGVRGGQPGQLREADAAGRAGRARRLVVVLLPQVEEHHGAVEAPDALPAQAVGPVAHGEGAQPVWLRGGWVGLAGWLSTVS
jgi:hypothetical protein